MNVMQLCKMKHQSNPPPSATVQPYAASAPGKTILFGEHSVVYNKLAVATAVNLRSYAVILPTAAAEEPPSDHITLCMPDVHLDLTLPLADLEPLRSAGSLHDPQPLSQEARAQLTQLVETCAAASSPLHVNQVAAALAALHLLDGLCPGQLPSLSLTLRSEIPIGSGLGSSASLSVAMVAAIMGGFGVLASDKVPGGPGSSKRTKTMAPNGIASPPKDATDKVERKDARQLINTWALIAEKVIHGNPSGVDNTVVTYGGALAYTKTDGMQTLTDLPCLEFLLIDSKVTKNTMIQVDKVRSRRDLLPNVINPVLDAMHTLASEGRIALTSNPPPQERLCELIRVNHALLSALNVGHPTLDAIVAMADKHGFAGKLTGAGGGGCALVYLAEGKDKDRKAKELRAELVESGFEVFRTRVGGVGVRVHAAQGLEWGGITNANSSPKEGKKRGHEDNKKSGVGMEQWQHLAQWMTEAAAERLVQVFGQGGEPKVAGV